MQLLLLTFSMEPPSSINSDQGNTVGPSSDDPLSQIVFADSYIVVTRPEGFDLDEGYFISFYSARTGLTYLGQSDPITS